MTLTEAYRTLGIDPATADRERTTKSYRDLVKRLHPDVRPESERVRATEDLQRINAAFAAIRSSGFAAVAPLPPPSQPRPQAAPYGAPGYGNPFGGGQSRGGGATPGAGASPGYGPNRGFGSSGGFGFGPQGFGPQGFGPQGFGPQGFRPQGFGPQGFGPQGFGPVPPGGFGAARPAANHAAAVSDAGKYARHYLPFEGLMARSGAFFTLLLVVAFIKHASAGSLHQSMLFITLAIVAWGISTRARRVSWDAISMLSSGSYAHLQATLTAQLQRSSFVGIGGFIFAGVMLGCSFLTR